MIKRTHTCGELTADDVGSKTQLNGWISKSRDLGGLIFIDLRDRYGKTQIVFNEKTNKDIFSKAKKLGLEDVIGIKGIVIKRPEDAINQIKTFFGKLNDWKNINDLIPKNFISKKKFKKTGKAGIFAGSLELVKEGNIKIKQENLFDDIFVREN